MRLGGQAGAVDHGLELRHARGVAREPAIDRRARIGVVCGEDDGAPAILTEYMLAGLPVLANACLRCGLQYIRPDTGLVAQPEGFAAACGAASAPWLPRPDCQRRSTSRAAATSASLGRVGTAKRRGAAHAASPPWADVAQGYLFSRPVPPAILHALFPA